jgi:hypothetical protein
VRLEIEMDGKPLYQLQLHPSGLQKDGPATVYRRLPIVAGSHRFVARLSDSVAGDFSYQKEFSVDLAPGRVMVIDFNASQGGFIIHHG